MSLQFQKDTTQGVPKKRKKREDDWHRGVVNLHLQKDVIEGRSRKLDREDARQENWINLYLRVDTTHYLPRELKKIETTERKKIMNRCLQTGMASSLTSELDLRECRKRSCMNRCRRCTSAEHVLRKQTQLTEDTKSGMTIPRSLRKGTVVGHHNEDIHPTSATKRGESSQKDTPQDKLSDQWHRFGTGAGLPSESKHQTETALKMRAADRHRQKDSIEGLCKEYAQLTGDIR